MPAGGWEWPMLNVKLPAEKLDPFTHGDEVATLIEHFIGEAEKQIRGIQRGPERHEAVVDAVMDSVVLPKLYPRQYAKHIVQVLYHHIARKVKKELRMSGTPAPPRTRTPKS
jgi:hypothetical protein